MVRQLKDLPLPHTLLSLALVSQLGLAAYGREYRVLLPLVPFTAIPLVYLSKESRTKDWIKETLETTAQDGIAWELLQQLRGHKEPSKATDEPKAILEEPKATIEESKVPYANLESLRENRDKFPHLAFLGKTGSGKSTLVNQVLAYTSAKDTVAIALAPHWEAGDYQNADLILGVGRNYGNDARPYQDELRDEQSGKVLVSPQGEPEIDFRDILAGYKLNARVTCCQFLRSLLNEMDRRYQLTDQGTFVWRTDGSPRLEVVLDEFPAWGSLPGIDDCLSKLLREARKVGIRLYLIIQGAEVKSMGIEGQGSLREQLIFFRGLGFIRGLAGVSKCPVGGIALPPESPTMKALEALSYPWLMEESIVLPPGNVIPERILPDPKYFSHRVTGSQKSPKLPQKDLKLTTLENGDFGDLGSSKGFQESPQKSPGSESHQKVTPKVTIRDLSDIYGVPIDDLDFCLGLLESGMVTDSHVIKHHLGFRKSEGSKSYTRGKELLRELKKFLDT